MRTSSARAKRVRFFTTPTEAETFKIGKPIYQKTGGNIMKITKRILSLILVLVMLVPMLVVGVDAAATPTKIQEVSSNFLGWEDTLTGGYASAGYYYLSKAEPLNGTAALRVHSDTGHLANVKIVDPSMMQGVTKYSVSYKFKVESYAPYSETAGSWPNWIGIRVNSTQEQVNNGAQGDWLVYRNYRDVELRSFDANAADTTASTWGYRDATGGLDIKLSVDLTTGTIKFYINGSEQTTFTKTSANATTDKTTGVWLAVCGPQLSVVIDDLVVTNDATGNTIYSENFDFLSDVAPEAPVAPGTVLYENKFSTGVDWKLVSSDGVTKGSDVGYNYALSVKNKATNDNYLQFTRLDTYSWGRTTLEVVSAEKLAAGVTGDKYSIAFDVKWVNLTDNCYLYFGGTDSTTHLSGNILYINTGKQIYLSDTAGGSSNTSGKALTADAFNTIRLDVEIGAQNATVDMYLNGTLIVENWVTNSDNLGAIGFSLGKGSGTRNGCSDIAFDNISVTSGSTTIYAEDFNDCPLAEEAIPGYSQGRADVASRGQGIVANNGGAFFYNGAHDNKGDWNEQWLIPDGYLGNTTKYTVSFDLYNPAIVNNSSGSIHVVFGYGDGVTNLTSTAGGWAQIDIGGATNMSLRHDYSSDSVSYGATNDYRYSNALVHVTLEVDLDADKVVFTITDQEGTVLGTVTNTNMSSLVVGGGIRIGCRYAPMYFVDNLRVVTGTSEDAPASFVGVQLGAIKDGTSAVRFAGVIGDKSALDLSALYAVGFKITASYNGTTKEFTKPCGTVYDTLKGTRVANGETVGETYTANEFGGTYIFATTIQNIPTSAGVITFKVVPYFTLKSGAYAEGTSWTVTYDAATGTVLSMKLLFKMSGAPTLAGSTAVDVAGENPMQYKTNATLAQVQSYNKQLEAAGYTLYQSNRYDDAYYYIYAQGNATVTVSFAKNVARVTYDRGGRAQNEADNEGWVATTTPTFTQLQINNLIGGNNAGMGYVLRLSDGRFVVIDGGYADADDHIRLYNVMKEQCPAGKEPVIAAWFITHAHSDHYANLYRFVTKYQGKVVIQQTVQNVATPTILTMDDSAANTYSGVERIISQMGTENVYARAGQSFYLADARIDVLFTADDVYNGSALASSNGNNVCVVFKITVAGQSIMILGDTEETQADLITARYTATTLKSDMVQQAHHGYWAGSDTLYERIDADVVFWPCPTHLYYALASGGANATTNRYNYQNATEIILSGNGTKTIALPHTPVASKPQNETYANYANGNVLYSNNYENTNYVYESGYWVIGQHAYQSAASETLGSPTDVYLAKLGNDKGFVIDATKSGTQIGMLRPELFRNIGKYKIEMDLTILAKSTGVYFWFHDGEPGTSGNRLMPQISYYIGEGITTKVVIDVTVNSSTSVTYTITDGNGNDLKKTATLNNCSSESFFALYLTSGSQVFIGSLQVTKVN